MKSIFLLAAFCSLLLSTCLSAQESIEGFWCSVNEKTRKAESIVAVYPYQGKYYGRLILTYNDDGSVADTIYNPQLRAPGVIGNPYYAGMDIIWDLKNNGKKFTGGSIIDPEKGNIYGAELWRQGPNLIVRGELLIFGRNQTWPPAKDSDFPQGFQKPALASFVPVIPRVK